MQSSGLHYQVRGQDVKVNVTGPILEGVPRWEGGLVRSRGSGCGRITIRYSKVKNFRTSKLSHTLQVVLMSLLVLRRRCWFGNVGAWFEISGLVWKRWR
jgi:hypothetical protein